MITHHTFFFKTETKESKVVDCVDVPFVIQLHGYGNLVFIPSDTNYICALNNNTIMQS